MPNFSLFLPENSYVRMIKAYNKQRLFVTGTECLSEYQKYGALESLELFYTITLLISYPCPLF